MPKSQPLCFSHTTRGSFAMRDLKFVEQIAHEFLEGEEEERASGHPLRLRLLDHDLDVGDGVVECFDCVSCVALSFFSKLFETGEKIVLDCLVFLSCGWFGRSRSLLRRR